MSLSRARFRLSHAPGQRAVRRLHGGLPGVASASGLHSGAIFTQSRQWGRAGGAAAAAPTRELFTPPEWETAPASGGRQSILSAQQEELLAAHEEALEQQAGRLRASFGAELAAVQVLGRIVALYYRLSA
jgi:hypothetical protein